MIGLTPRQRDCLNAFRANPEANYREIGAAIGVTGKGTVHRLVAVLEERGYVRRTEGRQARNRTRAIEVLTPAKPVSYEARGQRFTFIPRGV